MEAAPGQTELILNPPLSLTLYLSVVILLELTDAQHFLRYMYSN